MSATSSKTGGGTSVKTATETAGGVGGGIDLLTSTDGSVTITNPAGPTADLKVAVAGTPFPGYDLIAPPTVASASAVGTAATASRGDHTHGLDLVHYVPSLGGMQATGMIAQSYTAPNATPTVLSFAAGRLLFGDAANQFPTTSGNFAVTNTAGNIGLHVVGDSSFGVDNVSVDGPLSSFTYAQFGIRGAGVDISTWGAANETGFGATSGNVVFHTVTTSIHPNGDQFIFNNSAGVTPWVLFPGTGDFGVSNTGIPAGGGNSGFAWQPIMAGPPAGAPLKVGSFTQTAATVEDTTNFRHYAYFVQGTNAWRFMEYNNHVAVPAWIPYGGAAAHTLTSTADFTFNSGALQVGNGTAAGQIDLQQAGGGGTVESSTGDLFVKANPGVSSTTQGVRLGAGTSTDQIYVRQTEVALIGNSVTQNVALFATTPPFQGGQNIVFLHNRNAAPTGNPASGGYMYAEAGALMWRGSAGTVTPVAPA